MGESSEVCVPAHVCSIEGTDATIKYADYGTTQEGGAYLLWSGPLEGTNWRKFGPLGGAPAWCGQSCCPAGAPGTL